MGRPAFCTIIVEYVILELIPYVRIYVLDTHASSGDTHASSAVGPRPTTGPYGRRRNEGGTTITERSIRTASGPTGVTPVQIALKLTCDGRDTSKRISGRKKHAKTMLLLLGDGLTSGLLIRLGDPDEAALVGIGGPLPSCSLIQAGAR